MIRVSLKMRRCVIALFSSAILLLSFISASAQEYDLTKVPEAKPGDRQRLFHKGHHSEKKVTFVGNKGVEEDFDDFLFDFAGITTVPKEQKGSKRKDSIVIERCLITRQGKVSPLVPEGTEVVITSEPDGPVFAIGNKTVDAATAKILNIVIEEGKGPAGEEDAFEMFGVTGKKKVGDKWPIKTELFTRDMKGIGLSPNKEDTQGEMTLESVERVGTEDVALVKGWLTIKNFSVPLPPEAQLKAQNSVMKFDISVRVSLKSGSWDASIDAFASVLFVVGVPKQGGPDLKALAGFEDSSMTRVQILP